MRLSAGTVAVMGYLARQGWTLREFAEAFGRKGGDFSAVDPLEWSDAHGDPDDGSAAAAAGSAGVLRMRGALADGARDPGLCSGSAAVQDRELDAGKEKAPGMAVPEGVGKQDLGGLSSTTELFYHRRRKRNN